jgi:hypothetical protein
VRVWRYVWAAPGSAIGLLAAAVACRGAHVRVVHGSLEVHGPAVRRLLTTLVPIPGGAAAITFGHVVLGRDQASLDATRAHERVHVRQYERFGPFFIPVYLAASAWARLRGGDMYYDNYFEREAFRGNGN